jgi:Tol biopolymer transport system component
VPLTSYPGIEMHPTISPDGTQVAFAWNGEKQDNYDVYVKMVQGGGPPLRLTTNPEPDVYPAWSPDGKYIAFTRTRGIYLISPLGGPERKVCDMHLRVSRLSWSPDAKSIAFVDQLATTAPSRIFTVSVDTGEKHPLTDPGNQNGDFAPAFSPDGRWLAFARQRISNSAGIFVIPAGGGNVRRLTSDHGSLDGIARTPAGRELVFASNRQGAWALWRIAMDAPAGTDPTLLPGATGEPGGPVIGRLAGHESWRLVYDSFSSDSDVWRFDLPKAEHPVPLIASTRSEDSARYSPDGKRIVFVSDRSGFKEIWVCDAEGGNAVRLTFMDNFAGSPRWSPDGRFIVFDGVTSGNRDIYVMPSEGGAAHRLTTEPSEESRPSFSQDGRWIYFMSDRSGTHQIWKMPAQGGAAIQVTPTGRPGAV